MFVRNRWPQRTAAAEQVHDDLNRELTVSQCVQSRVRDPHREFFVLHLPKLFSNFSEGFPETQKAMRNQSVLNRLIRELKENFQAVLQ